MSLPLLAVVVVLACTTSIGRCDGPADKSIAFAIDTTGSMSGEINAVVTGATNIFQAMLHQDNSIKNFIVAPFNDPTYGPVFVTTNTTMYLQYLQNLAGTVTGGGDCPELAMHGIQLAISAAYPRSSIFIFTDASAADYNMSSVIIDLVQKKQCQLIYVLTGTCGNPATDPGYQVYHDTADASNGHVFDVPTASDVSQVIDYITAHFHEVPLESIDVASTGPASISFPVDSHLVSFTVSVSGFSGSMQIIQPNGNPATCTNVVNLSGALVVTCNNATVGNWTINTSGLTGAYSLRVTGTGTVDYAYGFSQDRDSAAPAYRPIVGLSTYILSDLNNFTSPGNITTIELVDMTGATLQTASIQFRPTDQYQYVAGPLITPAAMFRMKLHGTDELGNNIQRITSTAVMTETNPCVISPCGSNGVCNPINGTYNYTCTCNVGYWGQDCSKVDYCGTSSPCQNGGTCQNLALGGYQCICPPSYTDQNCSTLSIPCSGHGTFTCTCERGYTGANCESEIDFCAQPVDPTQDATNMYQLCEPHGTCVSTTAGAYCVCLHGFTGQFCDEEIPNQMWLGGRCALYATNATIAANLTVGCPQDPVPQHCLPDNLDCLYLAPSCPNPTGWCLPTYDDSYVEKLAKYLEMIKNLQMYSK